jgi:hypothetical protein
MKTIINFQFAFILFLLLSMSSCVNKSEIRKEIGIYDACITVCEDRATAQREELAEKINSCRDRCQTEWYRKYHTCLGNGHAPPPQNISECIEEVNIKFEVCKRECASSGAEITKELKNCRRACVPPVSNPN